MLVPDTSQPHDPATYVARLRSYFSNLPPMVPRKHSPPSHLPPDMDTWSHVFVQDDSVKGSLVSPYKGPFRVLSRTPKVFTIEMNGHTETVSVDRLKKAYFEASSSLDYTVATPTYAPLTTPSPSQTPLPSPAPTTTPSPSTGAPSTPYITRSGRTVHWPKKLSKTIYI
ncbi:mucin-2-like [Octopus sinensis]|uniref:Mucin-2-like n=1 Tax=Octopus sinensis TaxID=2607531 RepID=A0A6P7TQ29_9MOLL|nr:mucin-2-like [Octopus sinensis]